MTVTTHLENHDIIIFDPMIPETRWIFSAEQVRRFWAFDQVLREGAVNLAEPVPGGYDTFRTAWNADPAHTTQFTEYDYITGAILILGPAIALDNLAPIPPPPPAPAPPAPAPPAPVINFDEEDRDMLKFLTKRTMRGLMKREGKGKGGGQASMKRGAEDELDKEKPKKKKGGDKKKRAGGARDPTPGPSSGAGSEASDVVM